MKRHVFLMQVHKSPELFARIVKVLAAANHCFVVNIDKKTKNPQEFHEAVKGIENIHFSDKMSVYWGGVSQIYAMLALIRDAKKIFPDAEYMHFISGQDYPLRSNEQFDAFFEKSDKSYMCIEGDEWHQKHISSSYISRVCVWHPNRPIPYLQPLYYKLVNLRKPPLTYRKPLPNLWGGWNWWSLHISAIDYLLDYLQQNPWYLKWFNHTSCGDELFVQTIVKDKIENLRIEPFTPLRYVSTTPTHPVENDYRPYNLDERDFPYVHSSQAFFCRKVEQTTSAKLLDLIDAHRYDPFDFSAATPVVRQPALTIIDANGTHTYIPNTGT